MIRKNCHMKKSNLQEVLHVSRATANRFWNEIKDVYIKESDKGLMLICDDIIRGKINDKQKLFQKFYIRYIRDARKLLFMKLVDAKYYMTHRKLVKRKKNYSQEYFSREQINKSICCLEMGISRGYGSMRYKRYFAALRKLQDYGFIEFKEIFSQKNGSKLIDKITIVDDDEDSEVLDYITDYHHLLLHYERLSGADIGECKECGTLFRQQYRNKYKYCEEHRIKTKKQKNPTVRQCCECGTFFDVPVRGNTSKMFFCKSCQEKANKSKKIAWMQNKRKCVETK